ncbi:hypothetical protein [Sulfuricurvum sp.]|uniref:hypothetical protein n=1 Tax=Sulfuricurvum sp. TaxID=2025608 RepID=UPI003BB1C17C
MQKVLVFIVFIILIVGCSTHVYFKFPQNEDLNIRIYSYDKNITVQECSIKPHSEKFNKIEKLLNNNTEEWSTEFASILPHTVVSNSKFTVIFSGTRMIVNKNKSQYSHAIKSSDYVFLNCD